MKIKLVLFLGFFLIPMIASAHGTNAELTAKALSVAMSDFEDVSTGATIKKFLGVKGWFVGEEYRIKIYLNDESEIRYVCHEEHGAHTRENMACAVSQ